MYNYILCLIAAVSNLKKRYYKVIDCFYMAHKFNFQLFIFIRVRVYKIITLFLNIEL